MNTSKFESIRVLESKVGSEVAVSQWLEVTQARIDQFAEATNDRQWIHVDPARALKESPNGKTIAHGYLTLSLIAGLAIESLQFADVKRVINYGLNKVRFVSAVPVGSRLRAKFVLGGIESTKDSSLQVTWAVTVECEDQPRPACAAEIIFRYYV
jgi:acyl dehydratase